MPQVFKTPCIIQVFGASQTGKSTIVAKIINNKHKLFDKSNFKHIYYHYGIVKPKHIDNNDEITYTAGFPKDLETNQNKYKKSLIILDDLFTNLTKSEEMVNFSTRGSHHLECTMIFITQTLFFDSKILRVIHLNTQYVVLTKCERNKQQIQTLFRQIRDNETAKNIYKFYEKQCNQRAFNYILIDLHPQTHKCYAFKINFMERFPILLNV